MENIPPGVDFAEGGRAANLIVECLCIGKTGDTKVLGLSADGPSSLGDPYWLSASSSRGCVVCFPEEIISGIDAVAHSVLEVWVLVNAEPVDGCNDRVVG